MFDGKNANSRSEEEREEYQLGQRQIRGALLGILFITTLHVTMTWYGPLDLGAMVWRGIGFSFMATVVYLMGYGACTVPVPGGKLGRLLLVLGMSVLVVGGLLWLWSKTTGA